ncbi:MAG: glycosyltransferase, partial [Bacteroidales bacterium]
MLDDNKIVHSLWIGNKLSQLELLTLISFTTHGHLFYLWTYNPIETPLPSNVVIRDANEILHKSKIFKYKYSDQYGHGKGSYAGFSDVFRYALLYKYGGWWVDMDVTCLKPLDFPEPYVFRSHHELKIVGNIIKCPPFSKLMQKCYEEAFFLIDENNKNWNKPIEILNRNIQLFNLESYIRSFSNQDQWTVIKQFLSKPFEVPKYIYAIHWVNEEWRRHKINKTTVLANSFYCTILQNYNLNYSLLYGWRAL